MAAATWSPERRLRGPGQPVDDVQRYLAALFGAEAGTFVELRIRTATGMTQRFHPVERLDVVAEDIVVLARRHDVFVGVVPRRTRGGTRRDLAEHAAVVWADCDGEQSYGRLDSFRPSPSLVVATGTAGHCHAYWLLSAPVPLSVIESTNRAIAAALGADVASTDAARILRPPSFDHRGPVPRLVRLLRYEPASSVRMGDLRVTVGAQASGQPALRGARLRSDGDPLLQISPVVYVARLLGVDVPRHGKVLCPFHPDTTPSLHVYRDPPRGWYCFGCRRGGSIYDLAAGLWHLPTRGTGFVQLRAALLGVLGAAP